jgi:hypothetical protein
MVQMCPWLEEPRQKFTPQAMTMFRENSLAATFKCMDKLCSFFTSSENIFEQHLELHAHEKTQGNHGACSYCAFNSDDISELLEHITTSHYYDVYQCVFCFYRSASFTNVQNHNDAYHPEKKAMAIECAPRHRKSKSMAMQELTSPENLERTVPPLVCVCQEAFYLLKDYREHIETHRGKSCVLKCLNCNDEVKLASSEQHHRDCQNISLYQCAYCLFGCITLEPLKLHFANHHQSEHPIYCVRSNDKKVRNLKVFGNYYTRLN